MKLFLVCCLVLVQLCTGTVFKFPEDGMKVTEPLQGGYFHYAQPMYSSENKGSNAFIAFELEMHRSAEDGTTQFQPATVEVIVLESKSSYDIGLDSSDPDSIVCCTRERMAQNVPGCTQPNTLIVNSNPQSVWRKSINLPVSGESISFHEIYDIASSNFHQVVISKCSPSSDNFVVTGSFEFKNAYGYLPGQLYAYLPFYTVMSFIYAVTVIGWIGWNVKQSDELIPIHHVITATLLISMLGMVSWAFHYEVFNMFGTEQEAWKYLAIGLGSLRQTAFHLLMLCISSGLGIVSLVMGSEKKQIITLSSLYFAFKLIFDLVDDGSRGILDSSLAIAAVPYFLLEVVIYYKVCEFTKSLMGRLEERQQSSKTELYNRVISLFMCGMFGIALILLERVYLIHYELLQNKWKLYWLVDSGLFEMLGFAILCGVMFIFWPSSRAKLFIGADQLPMEEEYGLELGQHTLGDEEDYEEEEDLIDQ